MGKWLEKDSSFPQRRRPLFFFPYFALPSSRARKIRPEKVKKEMFVDKFAISPVPNEKFVRFNLVPLIVSLHYQVSKHYYYY